MLKLCLFQMCWLGVAFAPIASHASEKHAVDEHVTPLQASFMKLEKAAGGRLGVYAIDTATGDVIAFRADEPFPMCSTFKVVLVAAILERSTQVDGLLQRRIHYKEDDLVAWSPITEKHLNDGMTVAQLCAAGLQYSDNTAANLLIKLLGGPPAVTAYARKIGNRTFRLDRWETELNTCIPGDARDTVTPAAMAQSLRTLVLGESLGSQQRKLLCDWMFGNTTGDKRIRAALPSDWQVGDKTGSGAYGTTNDIAVVFPPGQEPLLLSIYYTREEESAKWRDDIVRTLTQMVVEALGISNSTGEMNR